MLALIVKETLASAVILLPIFLLLWKVKFHEFKKTVFYTIFAVYLSAVYFLVGLPTVQFFTFELNLNLIPFVGMAEDMKNTILNVFLFIPLGILLPLLWKDYGVLKNTLFFGFGMTFLIELFQLFTFRATDINDIITNSLGTIIGYFIFGIIKNKAPEIIEPSKRKTDVYLISIIVIAVMFFIQPFTVSLIYSAA